MTDSIAKTAEIYLRFVILFAARMQPTLLFPPLAHMQYVYIHILSIQSRQLTPKCFNAVPAPLRRAERAVINQREMQVPFRIPAHI